MPRYHPVTAPSVPAEGVAPLLEGLDRANATVGPLEDCPWRGTVVTLRIHADDGPAQDVVLQCDSLSSPTGEVRWLALGARAEAVVREVVAAAQR